MLYISTIHLATDKSSVQRCSPAIDGAKVPSLEVQLLHIGRHQARGEPKKSGPRGGKIIHHLRLDFGHVLFIHIFIYIAYNIGSETQYR